MLHRGFAFEFGTRARDWEIAVTPSDVTALRQVHANRVVVVERPGGCTGEEADAAVTTVPGARLLVRTADCAPVVFAGFDDAAGVVGVGIAHAGWKGLRDGVLQATAKALRELGSTDVRAWLGPCIGPECYEFAGHDLAPLVEVLGPTVRARTAGGSDALDLRAGVSGALASVGVGVDRVDVCTACRADMYFSWRARRETGRQGALVWIAEHDHG